MAKDGIRLAKMIAGRGVASRREAERMIEDERVWVNGSVITDVVTFVNPDDDVRVDGYPLPPKPETVYYLLFKPRGSITGRNDPDDRTSVFDLIDGVVHQRVEPVGRLDYNTEGALLLTNDGTIAHKLTHPSTEVPKRYVAKVYREPDDKDLSQIRAGKVYLEDGPTTPAKARVLETTEEAGNAWMEVTVTEGRNRLIRRMFSALGHPVSKLRRESFATVSIRGMDRGEVRRLTKDEVRRIKALANGRNPNKGRPKYKKGFARPKPKPNQRRRKKRNRRKYSR